MVKTKGLKLAWLKPSPKENEYEGIVLLPFPPQGMLAKRVLFVIPTTTLTSFPNAMPPIISMSVVQRIVAMDRTHVPIATMPLVDGTHMIPIERGLRGEKNARHSQGSQHANMTKEEVYHI
jgi:hypothetical protein